MQVIFFPIIPLWTGVDAVLLVSLGHWLKHVLCKDITPTFLLTVGWCYWCFLLIEKLNSSSLSWLLFLWLKVGKIFCFPRGELLWFLLLWLLVKEWIGLLFITLIFLSKLELDLFIPIRYWPSSSQIFAIPSLAKDAASATPRPPARIACSTSL